MQRGDVLCDRQSQSETAVLSADERIGLPKRLEQFAMESDIEADTRIGHDKSHGGGIRTRPHVDTSARWRELQRIRQEIPHNLLNALRVSLHAIDGAIELAR